MPLEEEQSEAARRRVLMLTHRVPYPPDRGDRIRAYHLLESISQRYDVTLAALADEPVSPATRDRLDALCDRVIIRPARPIARRAQAACALVTGQAITPAVMHDRALATTLTALNREQPFDTVLTYCTGMIGYAGLLLSDPSTKRERVTRVAERLGHSLKRRARTNSPRHVLDLVDVDSLKWARYAQQSRGPMRLVYQAECRRLREVEAGRVVPFDAVTVISAAEAARYTQHVTDQHQPVVVGNGVDLDRFCPGTPAQKPIITFTGVMSYKPNVDAVTWFSRRVMPRVLAAVPEARFEIVGKSPSPAVQGLSELPGVRVVGPVDETAESLRNSMIAVAPMMIAPGVQNKVLEAMACGLPVVCSSAAASGINASPGKHLIVSDNADDVAAHCARLLLNPDERARLGAAARAVVQDRYDWPSATAPMVDLLSPQPCATTLSQL